MCFAYNGPGTVQHMRVKVQIDTGDVGQREAEPFGVRQQGLLLGEEIRRTVLAVVRPVEADHARPQCLVAARALVRRPG